ncbi:MAG TPA: MBL fold metallo-hydrolase [Acidimicrobiales bacterium]|nr:MBL fold metallo-hydrolase [Acidimicrobiales bacterium]
MADMTPGVVTTLSPMVRRVLCPNPSVMTGPGTNTYLIGQDQIAVIDPGPVDEEHLDRVAAAGAGRIRWILVTHTHPDHSPGAKGLADRTGAELLGYDARDDFEPDTAIGDGYVLRSEEFALEALHTPGHASNHLCYLLEGERALFSGDHVMSGSTVVIAPPDGDMAAYLQALRRLEALRPPVLSIVPGHGPVIDDPMAKFDEYLTHRQAREDAILSALEESQKASVEELVSAVYTDVPELLHPIARYSVWAHLRKLSAEGRASATDVDDLAATWRPGRG